jgi:precorrin-2/cobalt-factor-2 C20-methyltransferase
MYVFTRLSDQFETEVVRECLHRWRASALGVPLSYRNDIFSVLPQLCQRMF